MPDTLRRLRRVRAIAQAGLAGALASALVCAGLASAQPTPAEENVLKAAFVYNFAKYTDWPEPLSGKAGKLRICTAGPRDGFALAVAALDARPPVRDKQVEVHAVSRAEDAASCQVLAVTGKQRMPEWLHGLRNAPVLTVGDGDGFAAGGGIIGLVVEGERLRFEINQDAAQRAGLRLSSQILKLARLVKEGPARDP